MTLLHSYYDEILTLIYDSIVLGIDIYLIQHQEVIKHNIKVRIRYYN